MPPYVLSYFPFLVLLPSLNCIHYLLSLSFSPALLLINLFCIQNSPIPAIPFSLFIFLLSLSFSLFYPNPYFRLPLSFTFLSCSFYSPQLISPLLLLQFRLRLSYPFRLHHSFFIPHNQHPFFPYFFSQLISASSRLCGLYNIV